MLEQMRQNLDALAHSFVELEKSIIQTRGVLQTKKNVPQDVFVRLDSYLELTTKQRSAIADISNKSLTGKMTKIEYENIIRVIKVARAASTMIRDDAREIIVQINQPDAPIRSKENAH